MLIDRIDCRLRSRTAARTTVVLKLPVLAVGADLDRASGLMERRSLLRVGWSRKDGGRSWSGRANDQDGPRSFRKGGPCEGADRWSADEDRQNRRCCGQSVQKLVEHDGLIRIGDLEIIDGCGDRSDQSHEHRESASAQDEEHDVVKPPGPPHRLPPRMQYRHTRIKCQAVSRSWQCSETRGTPTH